MSNPQRAPFPADLQGLRNALPGLLPILEKNQGWYGSIYFERRTAKTFMANLKQTNVTEQISSGAVLRIYNGYTLFEQATDDLSIDHLQKMASEFAARVESTPPPPGTEHKPYVPVSWSNRLASPLDTEITSQIPNGVAPDTPVHFGIRYQNDPKSVTTEEHLRNLKKIVSRCLELAPRHGLTPEDVTFVVARHSFWEEDSIFIDRETNMSQTLFRLALFVATMAGADRTLNRVGGLGGLEAIAFSDDDIGELLEDLKSLKTAERLPPGKYRLILGPVLSGVLAHEAFGHSQEGDTCARGRSKAWQLRQSGERVGNDHATIMNNPAVFKNGVHSYAAWGSYFFDEEGWLSREHCLLDAGMLQSPMTHLTSSIRLGVPRTANGKRESWANGVYTRQTNTYFTPGSHTLDELLAQVESGFLALQPAGGMEDPKGMGIQVGIQYLKEIKNGNFTGRAFKGPAGGDIQMTGYVPDVLRSILGKTKIEFNKSEPDSARHPFNDAGGCGKYHKEFVFAGCGGPYILLDRVTLG